MAVNPDQIRDPVEASPPGGGLPSTGRRTGFRPSSSQPLGAGAGPAADALVAGGDRPRRTAGGWPVVVFDWPATAIRQPPGTWTRTRVPVPASACTSRESSGTAAG
ncbi:MAG TPA: hypothetical protein VGQ92_06830, partial [Actinoplanes sp.]|nr:hypothetical protein [Actinoplanes sp.]